MEHPRDKDHALSRRLARLIDVAPGSDDAERGRPEAQVPAVPAVPLSPREEIERRLQATWQAEQDLRRIASAPANETEDLENVRVPKNVQRRWHRWRIAQEQKFNEELARRRSLEERDLEQRRLQAEAQFLEQLEAQRDETRRQLEEWKHAERARFEHQFAERALELEHRWQLRRGEQEKQLAQRIRDEENALQQRVAAVIATLARAGASLEGIPETASLEAKGDDREALRRIAEEMFREQHDQRPFGMGSDETETGVDPRIAAVTPRERPKIAYLPRAAKHVG